MNKTAAVDAVIAATLDEPIIFTTGYSCRIANGSADRPNHFYMTGSMGLASSIATGVALTTGRTTVVVDGDGSVLMNPVGLITAGGLPDLPLVHVVLDDGRYASTGGQLVPSTRADLCGHARASGYRRVFSTASLDEFALLLRDELTDVSSPVFIHCILTDADVAVPGRIDADLRDHARRFHDFVTADRRDWAA